MKTAEEIYIDEVHKEIDRKIVNAMGCDAIEIDGEIQFIPNEKLQAEIAARFDGHGELCKRNWEILNEI